MCANLVPPITAANLVNDPQCDLGVTPISDDGSRQSIDIRVGFASPMYDEKDDVQDTPISKLT
jgi:hypothetical protein